MMPVRKQLNMAISKSTEAGPIPRFISKWGAYHLDTDLPLKTVFLYHNCPTESQSSYEGMFIHGELANYCCSGITTCHLPDVTREKHHVREALSRNFCQLPQLLIG